MTATGTRRPQEWQCRFCDLGRRGHREGCPQVEIDAVTARALAAESRLSVPATSAALDAFRAKRAATHVCEHGSMARKCGNCDSIENRLESDAWQARALAAESALDAQRKATTFLCVEYDAMRNDLAELVACRCGEEWTARGLHAPECHADDGYLDHRDPSGALADAEASGRQHGLLAAAMWVLGAMDRYERARGGLPVVKWPVLDRGYRLALQNMLAALAIIDPARRVVDDGSRFCEEEALRGG